TAAGAACDWLVACSGDGGAGGSGAGGSANGGSANGGSTSGGSTSGGSANGATGGASGSGGSNILTESCGEWAPVTDPFFSVVELSVSQDVVFVAGSYVGVADLGVGSGSRQGASDMTGYVVALAQADLTPR